MVAIYARRLSRQILGLITILFRGPMIALLALCRFLKFNCIFTVYPGSEKDIEGYLPPGFKWARHLVSGKPFVAGVITTGNGLGRGLILAVPNTVDQFKKDKELVGNIMSNLKRTKTLTGAKTIAIAGQGPRFFRSHFPYEQPFVYGLKGRVFSVVETVERVAEKHGLIKNETTVAILGVGEIGAAIIENLKEKGYRAVGIDIHIVDGRLEIGREGVETLRRADLVVVQTPRGDDVVPYYENLKKTAILIDDAHPRITVRPNEVKFYKVAIGRPGVQFWPPLPGYEHYWIPGCVQESMVVAETNNHDMTQEEFNKRAKELGFFAHLIDDR
ncbi:MAG: hypothetical protein HPY67_07670 [Syntrophaceae bacterium]|nr:hypothetical protein [Syntrophaceae bacterium]